MGIVMTRFSIAKNPKPGPADPLDEYKQALHLIGSIFYYGHFKAETYNERELKKILKRLGYCYETEDQVIEASKKWQDE